MRPLADLRFIAARVHEYVKAHPSTLPLLGDEPRVRSETCQRGHAAMVRRKKQWRCSECERLRKRALRAMGRSA